MNVDFKNVDQGKVKAFLNFDTMVLPSLIKWIFILGLVLLLLSCIAHPFIAAFGMTTNFEGGHIRESVSFNFGRFMWGIVISAIALVLGTLWLRVMCESVIILFKIYEALVPKKPEAPQAAGPEVAAAKPPDPPKPDAPPATS